VKILVISNYKDFVTTRPEAEIFVGLRKRGHQVTIMTDPEAELIPFLEERDINVIPFYPTKKRDKASIKFIREELIRGEYDILQMYTTVGYMNGVPAADDLPVKVVLYRGFTGHIAWYDPSIYLKYFNPRVDGVVCNAEAIRELFAKNAPYAKHKFRTINKGHDVDWYDDSNPIDLSPYNVKEGDVNFICVANERPMKGIKYLLQATYELDPELPMNIFLVGDGMARAELKKLWEGSPLKDKIHILGFRKDIIDVVSACDVFVLSSLWGESITKSVIQAMAIGKAPLITLIPGNRELIINEESGIMVEKANAKALADGMRRYIENPELKDIYGQNAKRRIQTVFKTEDTVLEYEKFYNDLLSS